jgi:NADPH:quinone reductase and related Zn-dependent oxidoreductases
MKAIVCTKYGLPEVLKIVNLDKPIPKDNEILIKSYATTVTVADCRVRGFDVPASFWLPAKFAIGFSKPRQSILGSELSGVIEGVGKNVTKYKIGDEIFAFTDHKLGAYAEFICLNENQSIDIKPQNLSFEQSAALSFGGISALYFLRKANIKGGEKVLIYGASGSVGTYAVQLAKYFGATVTGICSTDNLELVKKLGADNVIDYTKTDLADITEKFDIVFDAVGKADISKSIRLIKAYGKYIHAVATPFIEIKIRFKLLNTKIKFIGGSSTATVEQINFIKKLAEEGIITPIIDRYFSFNEIVFAHKYVDRGHKKGNVTIRIIDENNE